MEEFLNSSRDCFGFAKRGWVAIEHQIRNGDGVLTLADVSVRWFLVPLNKVHAVLGLVCCEQMIFLDSSASDPIHITKVGHVSIDGVVDNNKNERLAMRWDAENDFKYIKGVNEFKLEGPFSEWDVFKRVSLHHLWTSKSKIVLRRWLPPGSNEYNMTIWFVKLTENDAVLHDRTGKTTQEMVLQEISRGENEFTQSLAEPPFKDRVATQEFFAWNLWILDNLCSIETQEEKEW